MRFTIVTPSYNQLDWLKLCTASVRDQVDAATQGANRGDECRVTSDEDRTEKPEPLTIEHLVQDAGTRGIEEFARERGAAFFRNGKKVFSSEFPVGRASQTGYSLTIYSENDDGMYDAINKGLTKATGDICAYLNCDEQYLPGTLHWISDYFLKSSGADVLFGAAIVTKDDGSYVCDRRVMVPTPWHTMVSGNLSIFTSSTFFRRETVVGRGLLFEPDWRICGDAAWALRLDSAGVCMRAIKRPLSAFAETGGNLSASGNPEAASEVRRLAGMAPAAARFLKPLVIFSYRIRRWLSGAYNLRPHSYAVYTMSETLARRSFEVRHPTFRWQLGAS